MAAEQGQVLGTGPCDPTKSKNLRPTYSPFPIMRFSFCMRFIFSKLNEIAILPPSFRTHLPSEIHPMPHSLHSFYFPICNVILYSHSSRTQTIGAFNISYSTSALKQESSAFPHPNGSHSSALLSHSLQLARISKRHSLHVHPPAALLLLAALQCLHTFASPNQWPISTRALYVCRSVAWTNDAQGHIEDASCALRSHAKTHPLHGCGAIHEHSLCTAWVPVPCHFPPHADSDPLLLLPRYRDDTDIAV